MRKTTIATAAALAALIAIAALAGCGGDDALAREYIDGAREKGKVVARNQDQLQKLDEAFGEFVKTVVEITPETVEVAGQFFSELVALVEATNEAQQEARVEYEKVLELDGADGYKRYALNRIKALDLIDRRASLVREFAALYKPLLEAALSGQEIDEAAVTASMNPIIEERDVLTREIGELNEEALDLADELGLE